MNGSNEINGVQPASPSADVVSGESAAGLSPTHMTLRLTLKDGSVERVKRQVALLVELAERFPNVRERLLGIPDLSGEWRLVHLNDVSTAAGELLFGFEISDGLRDLAAAYGAGDVHLL
jgi:hypothetical protein